MWGCFCCSFKMTMWADNVKFVKDILDSKYQKIDSAVHEVTEKPKWFQKTTFVLEFCILNSLVHWELRGAAEGCDVQQVEGALSYRHQDPWAHAGQGQSYGQHKGHLFWILTTSYLQTTEIEMLLETIISVSWNHNIWTKNFLTNSDFWFWMK